MRCLHSRDCFTLVAWSSQLLESGAGEGGEVSDFFCSEATCVHLSWDQFKGIIMMENDAGGIFLTAGSGSGHRSGVSS